MRFRSAFCLSVTLVAFFAVTALTGAPQLINFQGILLDSSGDPVTTPSNVTFAIWNAETDGDSLWSETQLVIPDDEARFNVLLGTVSPVPDSVFEGDAYLSVKVEADPEMTPRSHLVTVPYSYRVATVDGATGGTITSKVAIGPGHTNTGANAFVAGINGTAIGDNSTVSGGQGNTALGAWAMVGGGRGNTASGDHATVGGGDYNIASSDNGTVCGGKSNTASELYSTVGGGFNNSASGISSTVGGGWTNTANRNFATVGGGYDNTASGTQSTVGGGYHNTASGVSPTVGGGVVNHASGDYATIGGGWTNTAGGNRSTVSGGELNTAPGQNSTIGGGDRNTAGGSISTVGGGYVNTASGDFSTVGGGHTVTAIGHFSTIGGGDHNTAGGSYSTISGGYKISVEGDYSAVIGGHCDTVRSTADYSYLFGINSVLAEDSTFMVDMPHIHFGDESTGYEFPAEDGTAGQVMATDGNGQLGWTAPSGGTGVVPVGSITAWAKSLPNVPALPEDFVECNGQVLSDAESPLDGQTIPDLNGAQRFLRGGTSSGAQGGSNTHNHKWYNSGSTGQNGGFHEIDSDVSSYNSSGGSHSSSFQNADLFTDSRGNLPSYYEVVWIMRVK